MTHFHAVASFFRRESFLWKELLTITFNPNFVTPHASITCDSRCILWAPLTNSVSCSFTRSHLPKAWCALAAFFTYHIWSWSTRFRFKFVATATGAWLTCWPTRGVLRVGSFFALYTKWCFILFTDSWKSRRTLFTRQYRGGGINYNQQLQMGMQKKKRLDNANL